MSYQCAEGTRIAGTRRWMWKCPIPPDHKSESSELTSRARLVSIPQRCTPNTETCPWERSPSTGKGEQKTQHLDLRGQKIPFHQLQTIQVVPCYMSGIQQSPTEGGVGAWESIRQFSTPPRVPDSLKPLADKILPL